MKNEFRIELEKRAAPEELIALSATEAAEIRLRDDHHAVAETLSGLPRHTISPATMERLYALEHTRASFIREWRPELTVAFAAAAAIAIVMIAGPWGKLGVDASAVGMLAFRLLRPRLV